MGKLWVSGGRAVSDDPSTCRASVIDGGGVKPCGTAGLWPQKASVAENEKCPCSCCLCSHVEVCLIFDGFFRSQWTLLSLPVSAHFSANQHSPNTPGRACRAACSSGFGRLHGSTLLRLKKTLCSQTHKQTAQTEIHSELYLVWVWAAMFELHPGLI